MILNSGCRVVFGVSQNARRPTRFCPPAPLCAGGGRTLKNLECSYFENGLSYEAEQKIILKLFARTIDCPYVRRPPSMPKTAISGKKKWLFHPEDDFTPLSSGSKTIPRLRIHKKSSRLSTLFDWTHSLIYKQS